MSRLLHDRYLAHDARHAWDLATGALVPLERLPLPLVSGAPPLPDLVEALDHGRDGSPRAIVVDVPRGSTVQAALARAAADACARGYVTIEVSLYRRVRAGLGGALRERTLLLIARPETPPAEGQAALIEAAARSPRPHMLLTLRGAASPPGLPLHAREARAVYRDGGHPVQRVRIVAADVAQHLARADRATAFLAAGRHAAAERLLRDVGAALARRDAHAAAARVGLRLGRLLVGRGRALDADRALDEAAARAERGADDGLAREARLWQVIARTDAGHLTRAEALARALRTGDAVPSLQRRAADSVLARVLLWQGRTEEATAIRLDDEASDADAAVWSAFTASMAVRLCLARGDLFDAGLRARALVAREEARRDAAGVLVARLAHLRVLAACGDLVLAGAALRQVIEAARTARLPLQAMRARLIWAEALRRAGRTGEADRVRRHLLRFRQAVPPLLRRTLESGAQAGTSPVPATPTCASVRHDAGTAAAAMLVAAAQDEERDRDAVGLVLARVTPLLGCSRIDVWSADAGPPSIVASAGAGCATTLGVRVLEAGLSIESEPGTPSERGIPVRLGARLVAALVARWPLDATPAPTAAALLAVSAAVLAPRVEGMIGTARADAEAATAVPELVGISAATTDVRAAVARAAAAPFNVLVDGESGVGKELVARAVHQLSRRRERRFCDVNCAAIPDDLVESELFGHARGAFTGAVAERAGLFEEAHGGTLFLDEVADLSARAQAKLLRVLQQQEIRRVGETFARPVDVRVVSAANRDLRAEAEAGRFRQDLLYRLDVIRIRIPPLRERPDDIPVLARHFWQGAAARVGTSATLTHEVVAALARYHWPGNVRELQNVVAGLAVAAPARGRVPVSIVPATISGAAVIRSPRLDEARRQFERRFVEAALARADGRRTRAARDLGLSRQGLLKLMSRLGLEGSDER